MTKKRTHDGYSADLVTLDEPVNEAIELTSVVQLKGTPGEVTTELEAVKEQLHQFQKEVKAKDNYRSEQVRSFNSEIGRIEGMAQKTKERFEFFKDGTKRQMDYVLVKTHERDGLETPFRSFEYHYKHERGDAGYDLYVSQDTWLWPLIPRKVPLDFSIEIPRLYFGLLTSRSGTSSKGVFVIPGIIDSTYRGRLSAITVRLGFWPKKIKKGTRISQLIVLPYAEVKMTTNKQLSPTERSTNGFGSSGLH